MEILFPPGRLIFIYWRGPRLFRGASQARDAARACAVTGFRRQSNKRKNPSFYSVAQYTDRMARVLHRGSCWLITPLHAVGDSVTVW